MSNDIRHNGIVIRHEPDGELLAYLKSNPFDKFDLMGVIDNVLRNTENFSVRGVFTEPSHSAFDNNIKVFEDESKIDKRTESEKATDFYNQMEEKKE